MKTIANILLLALATLFVGACSSYNPARTETISKAIDLKRLDTFSVTVNGVSPTDTAFGPTRRNEALREVTDEFQEHGYRYVDQANADFLVIFTTSIQEAGTPFTTTYREPTKKIVTTEEQTVSPTGSVVTTDRSSRVVTTYQSTPIQLNSRQRLFVIDVVDAQTEALIWRGYTASNDLELNEDTLEDHIERIVDELPES